MSRFHLTILPIAVGLAALLTHLMVNGNENQIVPATSQTAATEFAPIVNQTHVDFRVVIQIFESGENSNSPDAQKPVAQHPVAQHAVLFHEGVIYDFEESPGKTITVFDAARKRVVLLDRSSEVRTQIGTDDLVRMTAQLRASASGKELQERLGMQAEVMKDETTAHYSVQYGSVRYTTTTQQPTNEDCATEFGRFADWASRLNIARKLGLPPFGRMTLNARLAAEGQLPNRLSLAFDQGTTTSRYHSTHALAEQISDADQKRIDEVGSMMTLYREVPLKSFPK